MTIRERARRWVLPGLAAAGLLLQGLYFEWQFWTVFVALAGYCAITEDSTDAPDGVPRSRVARLLVIGWVSLHAVSCIWAVHPRAAIVETLKALACALAFATWYRESGRLSPKILVAAPVMAAGFVTGVIGLLAMDRLTDFPAAVQQGRLASVFQYANAAGTVTAMSFLASMAVWVDSRRQAAARSVAVVTGGVSMLALVYTFSRGAWIALAIGLGAWLILCRCIRGAKTIQAGSSSPFLQTLGFLLGCALSTAASLAVRRVTQLRGMAAGHLISALGGMAVSLAYCLPDLVFREGSLPEAPPVRKGVIRAIRMRPYVAGALMLLLVAFSCWGASVSLADVPEDATVTYITQPGDTLASIAGRSPAPLSATELHAANRDRIRDPHNLEPGITLLIPVGQGDLERAATVLRSISLATPSFQYRTWAWRDAITLLARKPWGLGGGGWESAYRSYQTMPYLTGDVHSALLDMALNSGLAGPVVFISLLAVVYLRYLAALRAGLAGLWDSFPLVTAGVILIQGSIDLTFHFTGIALVFWACLGTALARLDLSTDPGRESPDVPRHAQAWRKGWRAVSLACVVVAVCMLTGQVLSVSGRAALEVDPPRGRRLLEMASRVDPLNGEFRRDLALALIITSKKSAGVDMEIEGLFADAVRLEPKNPTYLGELGLFMWAGGNRDEAIALLYRTVDSHRFSIYWRTKLLKMLNDTAIPLLVQSETQTEGQRMVAQADEVWNGLESLSLEPGLSDQGIWVERGKTLVLSGRYKEAVSVLSRCSTPEADAWLECAKELEFVGVEGAEIPIGDAGFCQYPGE